jgi:hypothetical protein
VTICSHVDGMSDNERRVFQARYPDFPRGGRRCWKEVQATTQIPIRSGRRYLRAAEEKLRELA